MIEACPLSWPVGRPRTADHRRRVAKFTTAFGAARDELLGELALLGARNVVISSNVPTRRDGLPYSDPGSPADPGVAVYFDRKTGEVVNFSAVWRPFVIACDTYRNVRWNIRAVGLTVAALRTIQRHGATELLEQAFTGFAALPPSASSEAPWWAVLKVTPSATLEQIRSAYHALALEHHPDRGGSVETMARINAAYQAAQKERAA